MKMIRLITPLKLENIKKLKMNQKVLLNGRIYTLRDQGHMRLIEDLKKRKKSPFDLKGAVVYYTGPAPARPPFPIGSCGPTTSYRMDRFTSYLLEKGVKGFIGKGKRSKEIEELIKKFKAVYFVTLGGCGALLSEKVRDSKLIAYSDLGPEGIYRLDVEDFPVYVDTK